MHISTDPRRAGRALALAVLAFVVVLLGLVVVQLGGLDAPEAAAPPAATLPEVPWPPPALTDPIREMQLAEDFSEELARGLFEFARELERGERARWERHLAPDFRGHDPERLLLLEEGAEPLGSRLERHGPAPGAPVGRGRFLDALAARLAAWRSLDYVGWQLLRAEFGTGRPLRCDGEVELVVRGRGPSGAVRSLTLRGRSTFAQRGTAWPMESLELATLTTLERDRPLFAEVTGAAGLAHAGPRLEELRSLVWSGAAAGDVDGDGLWDLFVPSDERNFLYLALESGGFEDRAEAWGVATPAQGTGAVFFDYDGDGDQDLAVADDVKRGRGAGSPLRLYRNEGGSFREVGKELGLRRRMTSYSLVVLDYDGDGRLDLFVCNYGRYQDLDTWTGADNGYPNALFRNTEAGFVDVSRRAGLADRRWGYAAAAADFDRDGDQDLYVANDFGRNALWRNEGDGTFVDVAREGATCDLGFGMSASWADFDNDGLLDLYVANMGIDVARRILARLDPGVEGVAEMAKMARGNTLLLRRGEGFELAPASFGGIDGRWAWAAAPLDVDLDGRLDLFCTNGYITQPGAGDFNSRYWRHVIACSIAAEDEPSIRQREEPGEGAYGGLMRGSVWGEGMSFSGWERDKLWWNAGERGFADVSDVSGVDAFYDGRAAIAADFDDDGDVDLFVHAAQLDRHHLYRNDVVAAPAGFLKVRLRGTRGNAQGVGAEVIVTTPAGPCSQVLSLGTSYLSCNPPEIVFGLGEAAEASVEVLWPGGARESFGDVAAGARVLLVEGSGRPEPFAARPRPLERRP